MSDTTASWYPGFLIAVGSYIAVSEYGTHGFNYRKSDRSMHFIDCGVKAVDRLDHDVTDEYVFDTFDPNRSRAVSYLSAEITCNCGEYVANRMTVEATLNDIIFAVSNNA